MEEVFNLNMQGKYGLYQISEQLSVAVTEY